MRSALKFKLIAIPLLFLYACSSEVDKCLEVEMAAWTARQERLKAKEVEAQSRCDEANARREANPPTPSTGQDYFKDLSLTCEESQRMDAVLGIGEYPEASDKRSFEEVVAEKRLMCARVSK